MNKVSLLFLVFLSQLILQKATAQTTILNKHTVTKDVVWASPDGFDLTMDIYTPQTGRKSYPVLIIFHGGGWLINNKSIMDQMAQYIVEHGEYVVCNVNYRLLGDNNNTVTMDQIIEDALGATAWIKKNIKQYDGDSKRVAVTGDSAGGHLAASVVNMGTHLSASGFNGTPHGFIPTYLPRNAKPEKLARKKYLDVQAAILSYGSFDIHGNCVNGSFEKETNFFWQMGGAKARGIFGDSINVTDHPEYYKAVSPIYNIPLASERKLPPQLFTVGSNDNLTTPELVKAYMNKVKEAGHPVEYWEYEGRPHAFLDSGSNQYLGTSFEKDAPVAIDRMIDFLNGVFYKK